jgi:hypothetical protein
MISFDSSDASWKDFLAAQPTEHAAYFKNPASEQGMNYFKKMLELINKRAVELGTSRGVAKFINSVQVQTARDQMHTWLDLYSPIRAKVSSSGEEQWKVIPHFRTRCNFVEGIVKPYYILKAQPRKLHVGTRLGLDFPDPRTEAYPFDKSPALTDLGLRKKIVKMSMDRFLGERTLENRKKLIFEISAIPLEDSVKGGHLFIQGGAVGSKR